MNDWRPVSEARPDGRLCLLRFRDQCGQLELPGPFFLHNDGKWYSVSPPKRIQDKPTHFKTLARQPS